VTAWSVLFFTAGWTAGANLSSRMLDRVAESTVMVVGFAIACPSAVAVALLAAADAPLWTIFALLTVLGTGVGSGTNAALTLLRSVADDTELGRATAAHQFLRNQGMAVGAALGGATILLVVSRRISDLERVRELLAGGAGNTSGAVAEAVADGFATAGLAGAAVIAAGAIPLLALRRHLAPARARRVR
jgi:MFS family permease